MDTEQTTLDRLGEAARQQRKRFIKFGPLRHVPDLTKPEINRLRLLAWLIEASRVTEDGPE